MTNTNYVKNVSFWEKFSKTLYYSFRCLEKAFDEVYKRHVWLTLEKKEHPEQFINKLKYILIETDIRIEIQAAIYTQFVLP